MQQCAAVAALLCVARAGGSLGTTIDAAPVLLHLTPSLPCRARKRRFESQFEDLQHHYLRMRHKQLVDSKRPKLEGAATRRLEAASGGSELVGDGVKADLDGSGAAEQGGNGPDANGSGLRSEGTEAAVGPIDTGDLQEFSRMLSMFTHHSRLKVRCCRAQLHALQGMVSVA